jgi:septum formation protein
MASLEVSEIIMASGSTFRRSLLASTGLAFKTATADFDEASVSEGSPAEIALGRAFGKAKVVAEGHPNALIIGADQVLALNGQTYGKVGSRAEAVERLLFLSGKTHELLSAFVLVIHVRGVSHELHAQVVTVPMQMRAFSRAEAEAYASNTYEWQGVVGCYQYENNGINLFEAVGGDHSSIIGLPLPALLEALRTFGINPLLQPQGPWTIKA